MGERARLASAESHLTQNQRAVYEFYKRKARYGGMEVSDARRLKPLEDENAKLKRLLAEAMLDNAMLRDVAARKW